MEEQIKRGMMEIKEEEKSWKRERKRSEVHRTEKRYDQVKMKKSENDRWMKDFLLSFLHGLWGRGINNKKKRSEREKGETTIVMIMSFKENVSNGWG